MARARQFSQRMFDVAEATNNPRDKLRAEGLASLISAVTGQYEAINLEVFERIEGGVLYIGPIGAVITAYGQGNRQAAAAAIVGAWSLPPYPTATATAAAAGATSRCSYATKGADAG
jgi:hypothetical protein